MTRTTLLVTCLAVLGIAATAEAHFKLNTPAAYSQQSAMYGDPQKTAPCGPDTGTLMPTNMVTAVQSGTMLSISITETIAHPGHYRVALAQNMAGLPAAPTVANAQCNGLQPVANPTLPVLADGLLPHTAQFPNPTQTMQVPIPAGMTCTNCVLQVLEYMANHAQPCFYYHCATVNISPNAPPPPDAGMDPTGDAGMNPDNPGDPAGGCCSTSRESARTGILGALIVGLALLRRRRR
ncbi:MAG TPA: SCE4755 family polysaccharide monooxygenase-like protein [Kofleriaceae bacterium]|nr:SCE4755 family polysaccharide monooxygenase-like protein [Kofleriaceae bacterium]